MILQVLVLAVQFRLQLPLGHESSHEPAVVQSTLQLPPGHERVHAAPPAHFKLHPAPFSPSQVKSQLPPSQTQSVPATHSSVPQADVPIQATKEANSKVIQRVVFIRSPCFCSCVRGDVPCIAVVHGLANGAKINDEGLLDIHTDAILAQVKGKRKGLKIVRRAITVAGCRHRAVVAHAERAADGGFRDQHAKGAVVARLVARAGHGSGVMLIDPPIPLDGGRSPGAEIGSIAGAAIAAAEVDVAFVDRIAGSPAELRRFSADAQGAVGGGERDGVVGSASVGEAEVSCACVVDRKGEVFTRRVDGAIRRRCCFAAARGGQEKRER